MQKFNFTANLDRAGDILMFFIITEVQEINFEFLQDTVLIL